MIWLLRAVTVLFVLCCAALIALVWWPAPPARDGGAMLGGSAATSNLPGTASLGKFIPLDQPRPAPAAEFTARDGGAVRLADFHGRLVLVNLWATWCAPCLREMPSLDRLQAKLGSDIAVLAVSQDRGGAKVVEPFLDKLHLGALSIYLDPAGAVGRAFAVRGLPTSILIDRDGRMLGQLEGAAAWDGPDMRAVLQKYLGPAEAPLRKAASRG